MRLRFNALLASLHIFHLFYTGTASAKDSDPPTIHISVSNCSGYCAWKLKADATPRHRYKNWLAHKKDESKTNHERWEDRFHILMKSGGHRAVKKAKMNSRRWTFAVERETCENFYYTICGDRNDRQPMVEAGGGQLFDLFHLRGRRSKRWTRVKLLLKNKYEFPVNISFSITRNVGSDIIGCIAIGDLGARSRHRCRDTKAVDLMLTSFRELLSSTIDSLKKRNHRHNLLIFSKKRFEVQIKVLNIILLSCTKDTSFPKILKNQNSKSSVIKSRNLPFNHRFPYDSQNHLVPSKSRTIRSATTQGNNTCNFEAGFCIWLQQSTMDDLQWSMNAGLTPTRQRGKILTGPVNDHTFGTDQGNYAYLETSKTQTGDYADLITMNNFKGDTNLEFFYHIHGQSVGSLKIFYWQEGLPYPLASTQSYWSVSKDKGDQWIHERMTIVNRSTPYKIILRATVGGQGTSDIAIDDISIRVAEQVTDTSTPSHTQVVMSVLFSCDFDYGTICNWTHPESAPMNWLVRSTPTPTGRTGANRDHTSGSGRFAYIETTSEDGQSLAAGTEAVITSSWVTTKPDCPVSMSFYYNMFGQDINSLTIQLNNIPQSNLWGKSGPQHNDGNTWSRAEYDLPRSVEGKRFQFKVVAVRGNGQHGDICIDDIMITQVCGGSTVAPPTSEPPTTTFDTSTKTSPTTHTKTKSVIASSSTLKQTTPSAHAITEPLTSTHSTPGDTKFSTTFATEAVAFTPTTVEKTIAFGLFSTKQVTEILSSANTEATSSSDTRTKLVTTIYSLGLTGTTMIPTSVKYVFSCDFESPCPFEQPSGDDFDWSLNFGHTQTRLTGPNFDHTIRNASGTYIYIETSNFTHRGISPSQRAGDKAVLRSPAISAVPGCSYRLLFYYSMYGRKMGTLGIRITGNNGYIWSKSGRQHSNGNQWTKVAIPLPVEKGLFPSSFQLDFEGIRGDGYLGDIALDDIRVEEKCAVAQGTEKPTYDSQSLSKNLEALTTSKVTTETLRTISRLQSSADREINIGAYIGGGVAGCVLLVVPIAVFILRKKNILQEASTGKAINGNIFNGSAPTESLGTLEFQNDCYMSLSQVDVGSRPTQMDTEPDYATVNKHFGSTRTSNV
ncbi:MAM domain containing 2 (mamdc2) [Plakobranchus ocellatus]|uniref:MAM domain containing 2 (Mamdc2) n=1 Tax=Plakobranchus ocellatus TaxID=259542 RepID=A0AAV4BVR0_9GAST|nr:MAM domain containing 2 (mamdc2) [Plakobranchus ocellatus]